MAFKYNCPICNCSIGYEGLCWRCKAETGEKTELDVKTNRIYINGKKVSGILTEYFADLETGEISSYIIGIGIRLKHVEKNRLIAALIEGFLC